MRPVGPLGERNYAASWTIMTRSCREQIQPRVAVFGRLEFVQQTLLLFMRVTVILVCKQDIEKNREALKELIGIAYRNRVS